MTSENITPGEQSAQVLAAEIGCKGETVLNDLAKEAIKARNTMMDERPHTTSDRYPMRAVGEWKDGDGYRTLETVVDLPNDECRYLTLHIGDTRMLNGSAITFVDDPDRKKVKGETRWRPEGQQVYIHPKTFENRVSSGVSRTIGLAVVASQVAHGYDWVDRSSHCIPAPWGLPKGMKGGLVMNDRESVLRAFGERGSGPSLDGEGPLRLHIAFCPNRNESATAVATTFSKKKVAALHRVLATITRFVPDAEIHFYAYNGQTVANQTYRELNFPGLWNRPEMPEWCDGAYASTLSQVVEPLQKRCPESTITLRPIHEVFGDLSDQPTISRQNASKVGEAYTKFTDSHWQDGEMARVTECDFKLNAAVFDALGEGDVLLSSKFHKPIFAGGYLPEMNGRNAEVGLVYLSREVLFGMAFD